MGVRVLVKTDVADAGVIGGADDVLRVVGGAIIRDDDLAINVRHVV